MESKREVFLTVLITLNIVSCIIFISCLMRAVLVYNLYDIDGALLFVLFIATSILNSITLFKYLLEEGDC